MRLPRSARTIEPRRRRIIRLRALAVTASGLALFFAVCGLGLGLATTAYPDRPGDVAGGRGPDITSIQISHTATSITFRVRFASAPPLRVGGREQWVDMLLIGIDVPPLGPGPTAPGGEWPGADFALGTHGPAAAGKVVRLRKPPGDSRLVATFPITTRGRAIVFAVPRRVLGNPRWFRFSVAAARESQSENGGVDVAPDRGTFRYVLERS